MGEEKPLLQFDPEASPVLSEIDEKVETDVREKALASARDKFITVQCVLLNTISTVVIVFLNKIVFTDKQLGKCQISIAAWHFVVTSIVLHAVTLPPCRAFKAVRIPIVQVLPISLFFCGFLILGNLSLAYNTVGFYQLAKIMTTPTVVLLNFVLFGISVSMETLGSVIISCLGVALVTAKFVLSNPFGTIVAVAAWTVTALYQIWIGKKLRDLSVSAPQLLLNQAPVSVVLLLCFAPFVDTFPDFSIIPSKILWTLFGSGILASLLNLSQFLIIGRTSALTFNVISQIKTIVIISLSWYSEGRRLTPIDCLGVFLALGGAYMYSHFQSSSKR